MKRSLLCTLSLLTLGPAKADTPRIGLQASLTRPDYGLRDLADGYSFGIHGLLRLSPEQQLRLRLDRMTFPSHEALNSRPPSRYHLENTALGLEGHFSPFPNRPNLQVYGGFLLIRWTVENRTPSESLRESSTKAGIALGVAWNLSQHLAAEGRYLIGGAAVVPGTNPAWSAFTTMNAAQVGLTWTF